MEQDWLIWTLLVTLGFPLLMIFLGEITFKLEKNHKSIANLLLILRNLVLPALVLFILLFKGLELPFDGIFVKISLTLLGISLIYLSLTFINFIILEKSKEGTWEIIIPKLLLDLIKTISILIGGGIVLAQVWDVDLGALLTALGIGSLVIGLALQDSLGNIFSGIVLLFEKPLTIGDWIQVGDLDGQVEEITWRSIHICTREQDLIIIPNSELAKGDFKNYSRPQPLRAVNVELNFSVDDPPNKVIELLKKTALETNGVLAEPPPKVLITSLDNLFITYKTMLFVNGYRQGIDSEHEFKLRIWYAAQRYNINMPYPTSIAYELNHLPQPPNFTQKAAKILKQSPGWESLDNQVLLNICKQSIIENYAQQEIILQQGSSLNGLYVILEGQVALLFNDSYGNQNVIGYLFPGESFGEKASLLSSQNSEVTVKALLDTQVLIIPKELLQSTIEEYGLLANKLGEIMELRRQQIAAHLPHK